MRTRVAQTLVLVGLAMTLAACGLFGVKGPGLGPVNKSSLDPRCTAPPYELPAICPLAGIGADTLTFNDSHLYVGSTVVIPGNTNFLQVQTSMGRVISFLEQFHANPPLSDREARLVAHGEVPSDGKKLFTKRVGACEVVEYKSSRLRKTYGKQFSAVLIVLRGSDPTTLDKTNIASAQISLAPPHSAASFKSC